MSSERTAHSLPLTPYTTHGEQVAKKLFTAGIIILFLVLFPLSFTMINCSRPYGRTSYYSYSRYNASDYLCSKKNMKGIGFGFMITLIKVIVLLVLANKKRMPQDQST